MMKQKTENPMVLTTGKLIIHALKDLINDPNFVERHKKNSKDFIRNRILSFKIIILFLISVLKEGMQSELGEFFARIELSDTKINLATNSAFTQARAKLNHTAFIEMNRLQIDLFYQNAEYKTWKGFRLVAVDGSTLYLPSNVETQKEFGISEISAKGKIVQARISEAFDPLNHITIDASIAAFVVSEQQMMLQHLEKLSKGDLALYDRNYPGFWIYKIHQKKGIEICMRIQTKGRGKFIEDFIESGASQTIVEVSCNTREAKQTCIELGLDTEPIQLRLVRINLESVENEVLIISLLDMETFPYECFKALYHLRWPVEEDYKLLKQRLELGNFTGKTVEAIFQDFHAKVLMANLTSIVVFDAAIELEVKKAACKHSYKINWNNAIQNMKKSGFLLFIRENFMKILNELHILFQENPVSFRPERTFARNVNSRKRHYSMCYK